jgi:hypothetical protein
MVTKTGVAVNTGSIENMVARSDTHLHGNAETATLLLQENALGA